MIKNKLKFLSFILYLSMISTNFLSAADCVDNTTGGWMGFASGPSAGCGTVLAAPADGGFGIACSGSFAGLNASEECPVTCSTCPGVCGDGIYSWDETSTSCPADVPGCDLPDLFVDVITQALDPATLNGVDVPVGTILYNSSAVIGGWQFGFDGTAPLSASGGDTEVAGLAQSSNPISNTGDCQGECEGIVLAFSQEGLTMPAGCGILTIVEIADGGTPTGLSALVFSDAAGDPLAFTYNCTDTDADSVCDSIDDCLNTTSGATVNINGCSVEDLSIVHVSANIPTEFSISQNFPNPFNPVTSISFDVAEMGEISLIVYDLSGKEVITLASGTFTPGSYLVNWDAVNNYGDGIASGMYVYRYIGSDKVITRKMLYLK